MAERMKAHVQAADTTPLLIFPEGTCVNNEYCVMFKRGAFDLGATVCPIAIKYNKIFVDAFWNSKRQSFTAHLVRRSCALCHFWTCQRCCREGSTASLSSSLLVKKDQQAQLACLSALLLRMAI